MSSKLKPQLVIIEGKDKGKVIPLRNGTLIFGRSKGDVIVQDPRVSRSHVSITFDEKTGNISFADLKSLNGTLVNGEASTAGELTDGDQLQVGDTTFDIQFSGAEISREEDIEPKGKPLDSANLAKEVAAEPTPAADAKTKAKPSEEKKAKKEKKKRRSLLGRLSPRARVAALLLLLGLGAFYLVDNTGMQIVGGKSVDEELLEIESLLSDGKIDDAVNRATEMAKAHPQDLRVKIVLGELYTQLRRNESAISVYREALQLEGAPDIIHLKLMTLYLRAGMTEEANAELSQLDRIIKESVKKFVAVMDSQNKTPDKVLEENPEIKQLLVSTAKIFIEFSSLNGAWDEEKTLILARGLKTNIAPSEAVGFVLHAQIALGRGETAKAAALTQEASQRMGNDPWALSQVAKLQFAVGAYEAASVTAQRWGTLVPNSPELNFLMSKLEAQAAIQESDALVDGNAISEKMKQVLGHLKKAEAFNANDDWVLEQKALALLKRYELEEAAATTEKWLKLYPDSSKALIVMSYVKFYEGRANDALPLIQKVIQMAQTGGDSKYVPDAVYLYGRVLAQQNKLEEAKKYIQQSCTLGSKEACNDKLIAGAVPQGTEGNPRETAVNEGGGRNPDAQPPADGTPSKLADVPPQAPPTKSAPPLNPSLPPTKSSP